MPAEENKALVHRLAEVIMHQGKINIVDELYTTNIVGHAPGVPDIVGLEANRQFLLGWRAAFPDVRITIEDLVATDDRVVFRYRWRGTQSGELQGLAPTGKAVDVPGISILRIAGGKVAESWVVFDTLGLMQQLGAIPAAATA